MYEHVGIANMPLYFATIARLLRPGGIALNHGITATDMRNLCDIAGTGLDLVGIEDLRPHYPPTLLHWVRRLEAPA